LPAVSCFFFFSSRRRHTRFDCDWSSDVCSSDLPEPTVRAVAEQARRGITLMLPSEDALWVGRELARRFGLPRWQFALTATDANRSEEHTSELQSQSNLVCRLLLEKKNKQ